MERSDYAGLALRLALAFLFFYFAIDKFAAHQVNTTTFQNLWLIGLLPVSASLAVTLSGVIEFIIGTGLLLGAFNRYFAMASAAWTLLIFVQLGLNAAAYDLALTLVAAALYFNGPGKWSVDESFRR